MCNPKNHYVYLYISTKNILSKAGIQPPKNKFRLKNGLKLRLFVTHQIQSFERQGGVQTPKLIYLWIKTKKSLKLSILAHQMQYFLSQGGV